MSRYEKSTVAPLGFTPTGKIRGASKTSGTAERSLAEIAAMLGISMQRVQQVEKRAMKKLRMAFDQAAMDEGMTVEEWLQS